MKLLTALAGILIVAASLGAQAVGRLADIAIVDRTTGRTLPIHWYEGRAYVVGKPGNEYKIVARNRRGEDLLAVVSVDGVNVLSGRTASPDQAGYVLAPWSPTEIKGWRKSEYETASFYFTELGDSYADRTGRPENVGVIGVALFESARYEEPPPYDPYDDDYVKRKKVESESAQPKGQARPKSHGAAPGEPLGTGHGRPEWSRVRPTEFERATDHPVETIAIYYDSYRNLVAQGVIPRYGRGVPQPFRAPFVPDPPRYR